MPVSSRNEADAYLTVSIANLGLLVQRGHISGHLAGEVALALIHADDQGDLEKLRALAEECRRGMDQFMKIELAKDASPEALTLARELAAAYHRAIVGWKGRTAR